jgi:hypothetical protein
MLFALAALPGCKRERVVYADREDGERVYQPRRVVSTHDESNSRGASRHDDNKLT